MSSEKPKHRREPRERLGRYWHFPDLAGPDLTEEIVPGQHAAMELLDDFSVAEIFSDDPAVQSRVFGSEDIPAGTRVDTIIQNLTPESATPTQVEVLETVLRPALEKYGTE